MQLENTQTNNRITVFGEISSECKFSHDVYGEGFYNFDLKVRRLSDNFDILPIMISERIIDVDSLSIGLNMLIFGQIRSYNNFDELLGKNRLILTIFAKDCEIFEIEYNKNPNEIFLNGYICKPPIYRTTPFGREIADLLVAVNRSYNKSDYIPCITWGRNARFSEKLLVGDNIKITGRMQSRNYQKKLDDGNVNERVAYEISVSKIEFE